MRISIPVLAAFSAAVLQAGLPERALNTFSFTFSDGSGELEWVSPSTFRLVRTWGAAPAHSTAQITLKALPVMLSEDGPRYRLETRYIVVELDKTGSEMLVKRIDGRPLCSYRFRHWGKQSSLDAAAGPLEHFFGLGPRPAEKLDLRGMAIETRRPFLFSTAGYAEFFQGPGLYRFDLAAAEPGLRRLTIAGDTLEYFFYFGPTVKEVFEEHLAITGAPQFFGADAFRVRAPAGSVADGSWASLNDTVRSILHGAMSGRLIPEFDLTPYARADAGLLASAAQVASVVPMLYAPQRGLGGEAARIESGMEERRSRLEPYLLSYTKEARDRGVPVIRPLVVSHHDDPLALNRTGEFMVGDELLAAPVLKPEGGLRVYLPRGIWTEVATGAVYKGRQEISIAAKPGDMPLFARNGTILPLRPHSGDGREAPLELHYFPSLGAEFFLFEESEDDMSQFHAAPVGDVIRLESESRVERAYDWVVHHTPRCRKVESEEKVWARMAGPAQLAPGSWCLEPGGDAVRVRVNAVAGGDEIITLVF